jgi:DNA-binding winged helix-turn-helix (wHTH) protein
LRTPEPHAAERLRRQYAFGDFTLDLNSGFLRRGSEEVPLRPKPFQVLVYLVQRHGELVTKAEIAEAIWPETAVMDNTLAQCLVEIRRALGDESQQLIRTVVGRGYLFTLPVVEFPLAPDRAEAARVPVPMSTERARRIRLKAAAVLVALVLAAWIGFIALRHQPPRAPTRVEYTQLTSFADSATSPALSPDGRMLAFIRSDYTFGGPGQIYVKLLPDGDPVQLTKDDLQKRGSPRFSPDGTRVAYAAIKPGSRWDTWVVPVFGGEPRLLLPNASGLTWIESKPRSSLLLFSELTGQSAQMAIVSSTQGRAQHRVIYMPPESGMAHRSYLSPDRKQVLVVEMGQGA